MAELQGRRRETIKDLGQPGDYCPRLAPDGTVAVLWAILPNATSWGRLPNKGHGTGGEPEWTITLEADGTVTVDPSIEQHEVKRGDRVVAPYWHGHLRRGVWEG